MDAWIADPTTAMIIWGNVSDWYTNGVTTMNKLFFKKQFDDDIAGWDTSNVVDLGYVFSKSSFNKPIASWGYQ